MNDAVPSTGDLSLTVRQLRQETADLRARLEASIAACRQACEEARILRLESLCLREQLRQQKQHAD
jgi:hypothetical protein